MRFRVRVRVRVRVSESTSQHVSLFAYNQEVVVRVFPKPTVTCDSESKMSSSIIAAAVLF